MIDVLIITAVKEEYDAVVAVTDGVAPGSAWHTPTDSRRRGVAFCDFLGKTGNTLKFAVTLATDMGGVLAVNAALRIIANPEIGKPRCLAMCGVCAGPEGKVALGDVIFANRVFNYEDGKLEVTIGEDGQRTERHLHEGNPYRITSSWEMNVKFFGPSPASPWLKSRPRRFVDQELWFLQQILEGRDPGQQEWKEYCSNFPVVVERLRKQELIRDQDEVVELTDKGRSLITRQLNQYPDRRLPDQPPLKVHVGPIGSGSRVMKDPGIFKSLETISRTIRGLEMEAAAIGATAAEQDIPYMLVAKGVMDFASQSKDDQFKDFAARASAECLIAFLRENLPPDELPSRSLPLPSPKEPPKDPTGSSARDRTAVAELVSDLVGWLEANGHQFEGEPRLCREGRLLIFNERTKDAYERVLVVCVSGEAGIRAATALHEQAAAHGVERGWLVARSRVSQAAVTFLKEKRAGASLRSFTFDELIEHTADLSGYFAWLDEAAAAQSIERHYVPLSCTKSETTPSGATFMSVYSEAEGWAEGYVDRWLDDPTRSFLGILGEFGMGKSWFCLRYAWALSRKYRDAQARGIQRPRIPLLISLRHFARASSIEEMLSSFFFREHQMKLASFKAFERLNQMGRFLLLLDGFDEMARAVDHRTASAHFKALHAVFANDSKVILTSRTEYFPEAAEIERILSAPAGRSRRSAAFELVHLQSMQAPQIEAAVEKRAARATVRRVLDTEALLELARRPVMIDMLIETLPQIPDNEPIDISKVYLLALHRKLAIDAAHDRSYSRSSEKIYFLAEIAFEMQAAGVVVLNIRDFPAKIRTYFSKDAPPGLEHRQFDMMGRSVLTRNDAGDYFPAHRSLLEFLVAYRLAATLGCMKPEFVGLVNDLPDRHTQRRWQEIFPPTRASGQPETLDLANGRFTRFVREKPDEVVRVLGAFPLTRALLTLLLPMMQTSKSLSRFLIAAARVTRQTRGQKWPHLGGNALTLFSAFNPAGLAGRDFSHCLLRGARLAGAKLQRTSFEHADLTDVLFAESFAADIHSVDYSPDGRRLLVSGATGYVVILDVSSMRKLAEFSAHASWVRAARFSTNGETLATASDDRSVKLWVLDGNQPVLRHTWKHEGDVHFLEYYSRGRRVISAGKDGVLAVWDVKSGEQRESYRLDVPITAFASPYGDRIAFAHGATKVESWNLKWQRGDEYAQATLPVGSIAIGPRAQVAFPQGAKVLIWDTTMECTSSFDHDSDVSCLAFSPDGKLLAVGAVGEIYLWEFSSKRLLRKLTWPGTHLRRITFRPDGSQLAAAGTFGVRLIEVEECRLVDEWRGRDDNRLLGLDVNDNQLATAGTGKRVQIFDMRDRTLISELVETACVWRVAFDHFGSRVAVASDDPDAKIWDIRENTCRRLAGHRAAVLALSYSRDFRRLATGSHDSDVRIWDLYGGSRSRHLVLSGHDGPVWSLAWSRNNNRLFSAGGDGSIRSWESATGECLQSISAHTATIWGLAVNPDDRLLASASTDGTIGIWNLETLVLIRRISSHTGWVMNVRFLADGSLLSCGDDAIVRHWNVASGDEVARMQGHHRRIWGLASNNDESIVATCSEDEAVVLWDVKQGAPRAHIAGARPCEGMRIHGAAGLSQMQIETLRALGASTESTHQPPSPAQ